MKSKGVLENFIARDVQAGVHVRADRHSSPTHFREKYPQGTRVVQKRVRVGVKRKGQDDRGINWTYPEKSVTSYSVTTTNLEYCDDKPLKDGPFPVSPVPVLAGEVAHRYRPYPVKW